MDQIIIHVDMDAFYASVEIRDNPELQGKPLIIGALPGERGVVATCNYEARKYGIHSAMNIKEAFRLCPNGIYRRPNMDKYRVVSEQIRKIWRSYSPIVETIALDEAYIDVTRQVNSLYEARKMGYSIKQKIKRKLNLTCSVGVAYSKTAAKTASEEKKPNGYYEIPTANDFINLIKERDVRALHTVGEMTAQKLYASGIHTVRDVQKNQDLVINLLGKQGKSIVDFSFGRDSRRVVPYRPQDAKSISREVTFQEDVENFDLLEDILVLLALCVENKVRRYKLHGNGVTLKITYGDMKKITRSQHTNSCDSAVSIWSEAVKLLKNIDKKPIRLIGVGLYSLSDERVQQLSFIKDNSLYREKNEEKEIKRLLEKLQSRYNLDFTGNLEKLFKVDVLHRTVEYMRKHAPK